MHESTNGLGRLMGKALRVILSVLAGVLALAVFLVLAVESHPQWILREPTLRIAAGLLAQEGIDITWTSVDPRAESLSFFRKSIGLDFVGLCIHENRKSGYNACFDRASLAAEADFSGLIPRLVEVGPIDLAGGRVRADLERIAQISHEKKAAPERKQPFRIESVVPSFVRGARVRSVRIDVPEWRVTSRERKMSGSLLLTQGAQMREGLSFGSRIQIQARGRADVKAGPFWRAERYRLHADLKNPESFWAWNRWTVRSDAHAKLVDRRTIDVRLDADPRFVIPKAKGEGRSEELALNFRVDGNTMKEKSLMVARIRGSFTPRRIEASVSGSARNTIPKVRNARLDRCDIALQKKDPQGNSRYTLDCGIVGSIPLPPKKFTFLGLPTEVGVRLRADLVSSDFIPSEDSRLDGTVDAVLDPILTPLLEGRGEMHTRLSGTAGEFPRQGDLQAKTAIELKVPDFQKAVQGLAETDWAVPAPFRALQGSLVFRAGGGGDLKDSLFPLKFQTRLSSQNQSVDLDAGGTAAITDIRTEPFTQVNVALTLTDLKVVLPRLDLGPPPRFLPDPRIAPISSGPVKRSSKEAAPEGEESFGYRLAIRTPPGKPVHVVSNLAKAPVPVNLDLNLASDAPPSGTIRVEQFPIEFFNHKGTVDHFDLTLAPKAENSEVDGLVNVPLAEYKVHVLLVGTMDKPKVKLTSEPPVSEENLLAALLFNRSPEDLDPNESATLGSTRATLSTGALGLASFYLLASTPIQGLTYNAETGEVVAQVRLGEGLSLSVGGSNQAESVGIRKRLGSNWFISTGVSSASGGVGSTSQAGQGAVSANLEWRKRY